MNEDVAFCVVRKALMLLKRFAGLGSSSAFATFQKCELRDSLSREMPMCAWPGAWCCYCIRLSSFQKENEDSSSFKGSKILYLTYLVGLCRAES